MTGKSRKNRGFTIVELLVVVLIISMLSAFVVPRMLSHLGQARSDIARSKMATIENALGRFYLDCGRYPTDNEGLDALVAAPSGLQDRWQGPYLRRSELLDPWGNPYDYRAQGQINPGHFDIISYGADGQPGGEGENAEIYND